MAKSKVRLAASPDPARDSFVSTRYIANPQAWAEALKMAGGDPKRLVVESDNTILILNRPRS